VEEMGEMKKSQEERKRYKLLIDCGNEVFERLDDDISNLNSRNMTFMGLILAILSIILTLILFLLQRGWQLSKVDSLLLGLFVGILFLSLIINILIFHPTDYKDMNIFEQKRFRELVRMNEQILLSDFLYHLKEAYEYNENKFKMRMWWFTIAFYLFIIANIIFVIHVIENLIWE